MILRYTSELQKILGIKCKPEPWLHIGLFDHTWQWGEDNPHVDYVIWVWDTRKVVDEGQAKCTKVQMQKIKDTCQYADDNHKALNGNGPVAGAMSGHMETIMQLRRSNARRQASMDKKRMAFNEKDWLGNTPYKYLIVGHGKFAYVTDNADKALATAINDIKRYDSGASIFSLADMPLNVIEPGKNYVSEDKALFNAFDVKEIKEAADAFNKNKDKAKPSKYDLSKVKLVFEPQDCYSFETLAHRHSEDGGSWRIKPLK